MKVKLMILLDGKALSEKIKEEVHKAVDIQNQSN